jgi:alpha-2-macroglobulin
MLIPCEKAAIVYILNFSKNKPGYSMLCFKFQIIKKKEILMGRKLMILFFLFLSVCLTAIYSNSSDTGTPDTQYLQVAEVSERIYQGGPAIAVILSDQLNPEKRYDNFFEVSVKGHKISGSWILSDNHRMLYFPEIEPDTEYTVLILRGLTAENGMKLKAHVEKKVTTQSIKPSFGFATHGSVLPERLTAGLPVMSINVESVDIEFLRVKDQQIVDFMKIAQIGASTDRWDLNRLQPYIDSVYMARFNTHGKKNKRIITNIAVENIRELQKPGFYIAVMRAPGHFEAREQTSYFFVSDIGLHARLYENRMEIISSSLRTAKALPDVKILVYDIKGNILYKDFTNEKGRLNVVGFAEKPFLITAALDKHVCFLRVTGAALDLSGFTIDGPVFRPLEIFVYAPRDLYRPGETVQLSALLRNFDGKLKETVPLNARIKRPDGREVSHFTWQPENNLGYYHRSFRLPQDSPTGRWSLEVRTNPAVKNPVRVFYFQVEEFLPERMKLMLESDQHLILPDEQFKIRFTGDYLYGAPASGNRLTISANIQRDFHPIESLKDFHFGNPDDEISGSRQELIDTRLDDNGKYLLSFRPLTVKPTSPMRITVTGSLFETGGRPVSRSLERTLWPASELVGVRPLFNEDQSGANTMVMFEVVKTNSDGQFLGASDLQATLVKEEREYYWEYDENRGWSHNHSETHYPVYRQELLIQPGSVAKISVPVEYGFYHLDIFDPLSGFMIRYRFYAGWSHAENADSVRPDKVGILLDKPYYKPGDTAHVTVKPTHEGEAVILVEANQLLYFKRLQVSEHGSVVEIPIDSTWDRHDIYITAIVLRSAKSGKQTTPNRAIGVTHLPLDRKERKLDISLDVPESIEPEKLLQANIQIPNFDPDLDKQAYVTLAMVDMGVLNITDFKTPDPFKFFFTRRGHGVDSYDIYGQVIESMEGGLATLKYGGDGELSDFRGGKRPIAELKILSLFSGPVPVDHQGNAQVEFFVPDFNGRGRIMAVAFTSDKFGASEKEILIKAPVVVELVTPRFLAAGDQSMVALDIHNLSGGEQQLLITVGTQDPLKIETGESRLSLKDNEKTTIKYPLSATNSFGTGKINVSVKSDTIDINRTWELSVRPAYPGIIRSDRKVIEPGEKFSVSPDLGNNLMKNTLDVHLAVSPNPPLNLENALKNLLSYPYGCLEQITSRVFPYLYLDTDAAKRHNLEPMTLTQRKEHVEEAMLRIAGMQNAGGGFSLWGDSGPEAPWLTPYVVHFFLEAKDQGFSPPDALMQNALKRLDKKLRETESFSISLREISPELLFADKAYCAYILARLTRAPLGTLRNLFDHHRQIATTSLPLVHLGIALRLMGDETRGNQAILEGLAKKPERDYYIGDYGSFLRDTAMVIHLLIRHSMEIDDFHSLVFQLDRLLKNRRYFSTQEQNALFLSELSLTIEEKKWVGKIQIGSKTENIDVSGKYSRKLDASSLADGIFLHSEAEFPLYASVEVSGYPDNAPDAITDHGVISREYFTINGSPLRDKSFQVGDLILVHLKITLKETIYDSLIIDLLPAGFELENQNLAHSERLDTIKIQDMDLKTEMENQQIRHMEFRDDRFVAAMELYEKQTHHLLYLVRVVTPGKYQLPAPYMEDMYRPEIRAIGKESGMITIEP